MQIIMLRWVQEVYDAYEEAHATGMVHSGVNAVGQPVILLGVTGYNTSAIRMACGLPELDSARPVGGLFSSSTANDFQNNLSKISYSYSGITLLKLPL
ncbi:MAG: hypothetical protein E7291_03475 [Lachnospiraceae bacterium]|nr:hypothetical protein [Lachnospiraceae bacterium]